MPRWAKALRKLEKQHVPAPLARLYDGLMRNEPLAVRNAVTTIEREVVVKD